MRREKALAVDFVTAFLAVFGTALAVLPLWGVELGAVTLAVISAAAVALIALSAVRLWLPLTILFAAFGIPSLGFALFDRGEEVIGFFAGLFPWLFSGMPEGENFPPHIAAYLAVFLLLIPLAVLFWIVFHYTRWVWLAAILVAVPAAYAGVFSQEEPLWAVILLVSSVIAFLPAANSSGEKTVRARVIAIIFLFPIVALALFISPKADGDWYSLGVRHTVNDIRDFFEYHFGGTMGGGAPSTGKLGLEPLGNRLGGDLHTGNEVIFYADGEEPFVLRGETLEVYTGSGWKEGSENKGSFRLESPLFSRERKEAFGLNLGNNLPVNAYGIRQEIETNITVKANFRTLFLPYCAEEISLGTSFSRGTDIFFNLQGEAWINREVKSSYTYNVKASPWDQLSDEFDEEVLIAAASSPKEEDEYLKIARESCLQVPETVPDWVRELTEEIISDSRTPYGRAMRIRDYIKNTCNYTRTPGEPDENEDFVAQFLEKKEGYCTYYASALTVMCRIADVPARYVKGYAMAYNPSSARLEATASTAHAWTEIYLEHLGWVPIDAVGAELFGLPDTEELPKPAPTKSPTVTPAPTPDMQMEQEDYGKFNPISLLWLLAIPILGIFIWAGMGHYKRAYSQKRVGKRFSENSQKAEFYYRALLRQLAVLNLEPDSGETISSFLRRCGEECDKTAAFEAAGGIIERLRFGGYAPQDSEIAFFADTVLAMEDYMRERLGTARYFLKAVIGRMLKR